MKSRTQLLRVLLLAGVLCVPVRPQSIAHIKGVAGPDTSSIKENFFKVDKIRIHYIETGTGPTVVLIHGNAGSVEDFEFGAIDALSSNYRLLAIDRPGHGRSERPNEKELDVEHQARLLHKVLSALAVGRPVLVGHSWGAALALCYALLYPTEVSALVLVAPAAYPDAGEARLLQAMYKPPIIGDVPLVFAHSIVGRRILRRVLRRAFSPQPLPEGYFQSASSLWLGRKNLKAYLDDESSLNASLNQLSERYSEISIPVVILTGDHDQIVSPKENAYRLKDSIANSQLIELKDTGHEIPQTHPESISSALSLIRSSVAEVRQ